MVQCSSIRVRFPETDLMGWAHHSVFFIWFEIGRTEWLREQGLSYRALVNEGLHFPVLEAHCTYKSALAYDDEVLIKTWVSELSRVHILFHYEIFRKNTIKSATGWTKHGVMREGKRKLVKMPELLYAKLHQAVMRECNDTIQERV